MSPRSSSDLLAELHEQQTAIYQAEEAAAAAERVKYPDAQWDGPALRMPQADYDPGPAAQQDFVNRYREEHPDADWLRHREPGDRNPTTDLSDALFAWRDAQASARWRQESEWFTRTPPCSVCGDPSDGPTIAIGAQTRHVCARCGPSVRAALAAVAAAEPVGDGNRTRAEAAHNLVAELLAAPLKAS
jgi:hypothetical protein